jgi:hypothetical protein
MLLHLATDEKFVDRAIDLFEEVAPGRNQFLIRLAAHSEKPRFVKRTENVTCFHSSETSFSKLIGETARCKALVLHSLDGFAAKVVNMAPRGTKTLWLAWGYDIYSAFPSFASVMFQRRTKAVLREMAGKGHFWDLGMAVRAVLFRYGFHYSRTTRERLRAISRLHLCGTVLPDEWAVVRRLGFKGDFVRFNYGWVELDNHGAPIGGLGTNILVGNSSTPSCNHADVFWQLSHLGLTEEKIIVPLSYGDADYKPHVIRLGRSLLGDAFVPLEEFVSLDEYNRILRSCGTVVMNHHRQQAMGNIISALHMGARVFLNEVSPAFAFLRRIGVNIFSIPRDIKLLGHANGSLSPEAVEGNRRCMRQEYSKQTSLARAAVIAEKLLRP